MNTNKRDGNPAKNASNANKPQKQVSLAGVAKTTAKPTNRRIRLRWGRIIALILIPVIIVAAVLLIDKIDPDGPALTAKEMVEYTVTPDGVSSKVSYFALGVTGESPEDCMDMVGVLCYDREKGTASVLQVPVATYIGRDTGFAVTAVGEVWGNPEPENFCSSCRVRLDEDEIINDTHALASCGAPIELRTGSSFGDLIRVFNDQYGLPIDNFLVIPRAGLVELIDALGGVDIELKKDSKLADTQLKAGVRTLTGEQAVDYAITDSYSNTPYPANDLSRMERQRQLFAALWQELGACDLEDLFELDKKTEAVDGIFGDLMNGPNAIRFNATSYGKARLLNITEKKADELKLSQAIAMFVEELTEISLDKVTFSVLPGEAYKEGTSIWYSVNRAQAITLLNDKMNPYDLTLDDSTVTAPQLYEKPDAVEIVSVTLDTVVPAPQKDTTPDTEKGE